MMFGKDEDQRCFSSDDDYDDDDDEDEQNK